VDGDDPIVVQTVPVDDRYPLNLMIEKDIEEDKTSLPSTKTFLISCPRSAFVAVQLVKILVRLELAPLLERVSPDVDKIALS
jgi:hypothetical protein